MGILNSAPENRGKHISVTIDDGLPSVEARSGEPLARSRGPADHGPWPNTVCSLIAHQSGRDLERHRVALDRRLVASETPLIRVAYMIEHQSLHRGDFPRRYASTYVLYSVTVPPIPHPRTHQTHKNTRDFEIQSPTPNFFGCSDTHACTVNTQPSRDSSNLPFRRIQYSGHQAQSPLARCHLHHSMPSPSVLNPSSGHEHDTEPLAAPLASSPLRLPPRSFSPYWAFFGRSRRFGFLALGILVLQFSTFFFLLLPSLHWRGLHIAQEPRVANKFY